MCFLSGVTWWGEDMILSSFPTSGLEEHYCRRILNIGNTATFFTQWPYNSQRSTRDTCETGTMHEFCNAPYVFSSVYPICCSEASYNM